MHKNIFGEVVSVQIHAAHVFTPGRIQENTPGELFMYWFRARGYYRAIRRPPDYSSNLCPLKTFAIWLFKGVFWASKYKKSYRKEAQNTPQKSYSKCFRWTQIRWVIRRSSSDIAILSLRYPISRETFPGRPQNCAISPLVLSFKQGTCVWYLILQHMSRYLCDTPSLKQAPKNLLYHRYKHCAIWKVSLLG